MCTLSLFSTADEAAAALLLDDGKLRVGSPVEFALVQVRPAPRAGAEPFGREGGAHGVRTLCV